MSFNLPLANLPPLGNQESPRTRSDFDLDDFVCDESPCEDPGVTIPEEERGDGKIGEHDRIQMKQIFKLI